MTWNSSVLPVALTGTEEVKEGPRGNSSSGVVAEGPSLLSAETGHLLHSFKKRQIPTSVLCLVTAHSSCQENETHEAFIYFYPVTPPIFPTSSLNSWMDNYGGQSGWGDDCFSQNFSVSSTPIQTGLSKMNVLIHNWKVQRGQASGMAGSRGPCIRTISFQFWALLASQLVLLHRGLFKSKEIFCLSTSLWPWFWTCVYGKGLQCLSELVLCKLSHFWSWVWGSLH